MSENNLTNFQVSWISGMPRSGTTWLSQIFASSPDVRLKFCPLFSYEFKNSLDERSSSEQWQEMFFSLYETRSEFLDQDHLRKYGLIPRFDDKRDAPGHLMIKSNRFHNLTPYILRLNENVRFVHIVRHPCATIYSWLTDPREFPETANPMTEWRTGLCRKTGLGEFWGFDDWKLVTTQALKMSKLYPDQHCVVRYEDLVSDTLVCTEALFSFLGLTLVNSTKEFITKSQSKHDVDKHSVFKNPDIKSKWREQLSPKIIDACMREVVGTELEQFTVD